ncbi:aminoglycoside phosphotransferase family protein [Desertihabitans brevis]|uniref:Aminoglycoside phosphotransferase family protein n=1 Tax=Desertihabitans brevis TaxID=2268447 RepID=A0A367Z122_9ACTN|nr:phosphotransferase [Desertihabitans brevis]RCK70982.1 aminoglycoside phosphotransferase family protein [Desertihabitans brevis]
MTPPTPRDASAAARAVASSLGLVVEEVLVLQRSNAVTLRLLPCDVVARVAPAADPSAATQLELGRQLVAAGAPVAGPDPRVEPRVHPRDGFALTFWTHHAPTAAISPEAYAEALERLHTGLRQVDVRAPHATDRVDEALALVTQPERTPALDPPGRTLLEQTLRRLRRRVAGAPGEQLLHGEPHPGNVLGTADGPVFIDLETCCRGPVEFDLAHAPDEVAGHYPGLDHDLLRDCRTLVLAMITTWRWDAGDQLPDGRRLGTEWLLQLRLLTARQAG